VGEPVLVVVLEVSELLDKDTMAGLLVGWGQLAVEPVVTV